MVILDNSHFVDVERSKLLPAVISKCEEFRLLGYRDVTVDQLWVYLKKKKWKKSNEPIAIHQLVNDILSVKIGDYMNYATIETFKDAERNSGPNFEAYKDLFS